MAKRPKTVSATVKAAIRDSGESLRAIGRATGMDVAILSRFMRGERDVGAHKIDKLCTYLGLELRARKRKRG